LKELDTLNKKKTILFLCTGNSCRSQIAEGLGKKYLTNFQIYSAGTIPEKINSNAIKVMDEIGIDISNQYSKKIDNDKLNQYDFVITLCGDAKDKCPILNTSKHIHWSIPDPAKISGNKKQILDAFSTVRDSILNHVKLFNKQFKE
tara:strand:- start:270 stop:707 length:438 start_codon:yes stop_codon:yes gene_type:complete